MRQKVATFGNFFVHSALVRCHLESTWFWNWYTVLNIKWCSDQYLTRILFPIWVIIKEMSCKLREMSMSNCQPDRTNRPSLAAASPTSPIHDEGDNCSIIHVLLSIAAIFFSKAPGVGAFIKNYYIILVQFSEFSTAETKSRFFPGRRPWFFPSIYVFSRVIGLAFVVKTQRFW